MGIGNCSVILLVTWPAKSNGGYFCNERVWNAVVCFNAALASLAGLDFGDLLHLKLLLEVWSWSSLNSEGYEMITWLLVQFSGDIAVIRLLFVPLKSSVSFWYLEQSAGIPRPPHLCHFLAHNSFTNVVYLILKHNFHIFHFILHNSNLVNKLELQ